MPSAPFPLLQDCEENDRPKEGARADFYCFGGWEEMIPYSSLPHGYGYFSDPYSSISIKSGGGGNGGGYSDYNTVGFNQARIYFSRLTHPRLRRYEGFGHLGLLCCMLSASNVGMPSRGPPYSSSDQSN